MSNLKEVSSALLAEVKRLQETLSPELARVGKSSAAVNAATHQVAASWSGSWMGYHSELYYRDFALPPLENSFSPEWGGIDGIPPGWQKRSADDVKERIDTLSGESVAALEKSTDKFLQDGKALQSEIVTELSGIHHQPGLEQEKDLLRKLENFVWGHSMGEIVHAKTPNQVISRDSEAVYQGIKLPAHEYYSAVALQKKSECDAVAEFFKAASRLLRQVELNSGPMALSDGADQQPVKAVLAVCDRFHIVARQLEHRREARATLKIEDEYDVQDLLHALLRLYFDDIRPEEWTPSYGGGGSRMDFLLKGHDIVVEAKMTRKGLLAKEVSEQLIIDAAKYNQHSECKTLVCLVYDPTGLVKNPRGIERDLAKLSNSGLEVICVVTP